MRKINNFKNNMFKRPLKFKFFLGDIENAKNDANI